ncbi:MAG: glutamate-1-semialdehyde 2,1-aminomutase [Firmicutes bacterium]|nr:glutamate-1-semialdehyde 2,1-aminomutase [Bacillota bacterium]
MERSERLFREAERYLPGGVNSPVRAFRSVGMNPVFVERGAGSRIFDVDGNEYVDYVASWGPLILGHAHPKVVAAVSEAAARGTSYGAPTELEIQLARLVTSMVPSVERVRMVNSGTEAAMSALRLARGFTGRSKLVKFAGNYHGHADSFLIKAGSGATTLGIPDSPGVTPGAAQDTLTLEYNDLDAAGQVFAEHGDQIAAVMVEPVAGNMGVVPPEDGFLEGLRTLTAQAGSLLIFDEVITGFRLSPGGAQEVFRVRPDLSCFGKIIGGGLPVGAYGGRADVMDMVSPVGPVYQAGTLSGNPLAMAAGVATLETLSEENAYSRIDKMSGILAEGLVREAERAGVPVFPTRVGSMFSLFFTSCKVYNYSTARKSNTRAYAEYFKVMLQNGVYLAPSQFEAGFISLAHRTEDIELTLQAARKAFEAVNSLARTG